MAAPKPPADKEGASKGNGAGTKSALPVAATVPRAMPPAKPPALPPLYKKPEPLDRARHARLRLSRPDDFAAARGVGVAPITLNEFASVAQHYPIVFLQGQADRAPMPVAVLGPRPDENMFVDAKGAWQTGRYVPAYFRRYPFITGEQSEGRALVLVDVASDKLSEKEGAPLFANGEPTALTKSMVQLCQQFHQAGMATAEFAQALGKAGVLADRTIQATGAGGAKVAWRGMKAVDGKKLNEVPWQTFLEWREKNWLGPIYLQMFSLNHFGAIAAQKLAQDAAKTGKK